MKHCKLLCAPMATLSHEAFRRLIERFGGCDEYYTEMINAGSLLTRGPFEKYYLMNGPVPQKIVWQLTGSKIEHLAVAAEMVASLGGIGIDLNMGCSAPEIYHSGAGISWMLKPLKETQMMVRSVKDSLISYAASSQTQPLRLSVKLRLGDDDFTEAAFFHFTDMLVQEGVTRLVLHPRTKKEKYSRPPRWPYVEQLACRYLDSGISVILNGAVKDCASAAAAMEAAPHAEGIMIARAAVQKPWLFAELKYMMEKGETVSAGGEYPDAHPRRTATPVNGQSYIDLQKLALDYLDDIQKYQPQEFWKTRAQRFFTYYCDNFSFAHYAQSQMLNASDLDDSRKRLAAYFEKVPEDRYLLTDWSGTCSASL